MKERGDKGRDIGVESRPCEGKGGGRRREVLASQ